MTAVRRLAGYLLGLAAALLPACFSESHVAFPHVQHLTALECGGPGQPRCPTCSSCHVDVARADHPRPPTVDRCSNCHRRPDAAIDQSLRVSPEAMRARSEIFFSHRNHLRLRHVAGQCFGCHAGVVEPGSPSGAPPPMSTCLNCHQRDFDQGRCTPCHRSEALPTLVPETFMRHDATWMRRHGIDASRQQNVCQQCHTQSWCQDCHNTERHLPMTLRKAASDSGNAPHPLDFVNQHAIEANARPGTCSSCHAPSSCNTCHVLRGVSAARPGAVNPHPIGWLGADAGSRDFHGRAARRDIEACSACHDQGPATNCIRCHRPGGPGGRPHPRNWESSRSQNQPPCRYCHAE
jgi:hypothetical protein